MNVPEEVKAHAVSSAEINWKGSGSCATNQAHSCVIPDWIDEFGVGKLPAGNFAGGKDRQHSSASKPGQRFSHSAAIRIDAGRPASVVPLKWIDEYAMPRKLWKISQHVVRHDFYVRTDARQQHGQHRPIKHSERVIGNYYNRSLRGYPLQVGVIHA
jgi:hypothetical protein